MKPALFVIDMQKEFFKSSPQTAQSFKEAIETINAAIALFRAKNLPVVCIQHMNEQDSLMPGEDVFELPEELNILATDIRIHKTYGNAFNKTSLLSKIHELDVDTIIVSGFSQPDRVRKAQEMGAGAFVRKPYILERIGIAIREELSRNVA